MAIYYYSAKDSNGATVSGELVAETRRSAVQQLASQRLRPVSLSESIDGAAQSKKADNPINAWISKRSGSREREVKLTRKVALPFLSTIKELLGCGIQAGDALRMLSVRLNDVRQKRLASLLWDDLRQGKSLSEAFRAKPEVFEESVVNLVEAGEATGNLSNVLERIVANMEERRAIQNKLTAALAYPIFLIGICIGLVFLFLFYLLPQIQDLLNSLGSKLPLATRILIGVSEFMLSYGWIVMALVVVGVVSLLSWRKTLAGRLQFDKLILRLPWLGNFFRDTQVIRITQTLSLLLENGITMVQSLYMVERSVSNMWMRVNLVEARSKVVEGASLSSAFKATGYFDEMALDIFTVGENTGNIVPGLKQMTSQYSEFIDKFIKSFLGIISIGVLLTAFSFVALIAFGIISSVFQLSSGLSAG